MTARWDDRDDDVITATRNGIRFRIEDDTADDTTGDEFVWVAVLACLGCIITACGLATIVVQLAYHWRGASELLLAGGVVGYFLRTTRR